MTFFGTDCVTLDSKNRMVIPAAYRDDFHGTIVIFAGPRKYLSVYSVEDIEQLMKELSAKVMRIEDPEKREQEKLKVKNFAVNTYRIAIDTAGRFTMPKKLIDKAGLSGEVYVVGTTGTLEIWSKENYLKSGYKPAEELTENDIPAELW